MLDPARLVFIDETAASTNMVRLRGRAPRGIRLIGCAPLGAWETITFVAALRHNRMTAPMVINGAMSGETFLAHVEQCLLPTLHRNDVLVMDNLRAHKVLGVREAIETARATVRYRSFVTKLGADECASYFRHAGYASIRAEPALGSDDHPDMDLRPRRCTGPVVVS